MTLASLRGDGIVSAGVAVWRIVPRTPDLAAAFFLLNH